MPRVTKAQLEQQLANARGDIAFYKDELRTAQGMVVEYSLDLTKVKDLYTRVRVAIGGGTGQEPWDIFAKIEDIKGIGAYWHSRSDYWRHEWTKEVDKVFALENPAPWHERVRAKVAAWWIRNYTVVLMYAVAAWIAGLWFVIGRASVQ